MIIGIGNDLIDIRRIEASLARFGSKFETRVFTSGEQQKAHGRANAGAKSIASTYAKRFAAKEACVKALAGAQGISWLDMEVISLPSGAPTLRLSGAALMHLTRLVPAGEYPFVHLTLTDEYPYALAQVIIETRMKPATI